MLIAVASFSREGLKLGSGVQISKLALGLVVGAGGANFEIGTPDPRLLCDWLARLSNLDDLANQSKCLTNRGLVIGWPSLPVGAQRAFRFPGKRGFGRGLNAIDQFGEPRSGWGCDVVRPSLSDLRRQVVEGGQDVREEHLVEAPANRGLSDKMSNVLRFFLRATLIGFCGRVGWSVTVWSAGLVGRPRSVDCMQIWLALYSVGGFGIGVGRSDFKIGLGAAFHS